MGVTFKFVKSPNMSLLSCITYTQVKWYFSCTVLPPWVRYLELIIFSLELQPWNEFCSPMLWALKLFSHLNGPRALMAVDFVSIKELPGSVVPWESCSGFPDTPLLVARGNLKTWQMHLCDNYELGCMKVFDQKQRLFAMNFNFIATVSCTLSCRCMCSPPSKISWHLITVHRGMLQQ